MGGSLCTARECFGDSVFLQLQEKRDRDGDTHHMEKKLRAGCLVRS